MYSKIKTQVSIIPAPERLTQREGFFKISEKTVFNCKNETDKAATLINEQLKTLYNKQIKINHGIEQNFNAINLIQINNLNIQPEAYVLSVTTTSVDIKGDAAGIFYGLQTLLQLINETDDHSLLVPCVEIKDSPRFTWRGMHLDVARHFYRIDFIKKYIDYLAFYKMNVFHWHLTDDQGWRIEIKEYPLLTQIGAYRNGTLIGHSSESPERYDNYKYGGFYTQDEIIDIVNYAQQRNITIVPEIEMPGHELAALAAYPELACFPKNFDPAKSWGIFNDVFCTKEETFTFLENVLSEVMNLFPGKYIHIGGDECPKVRWKKCPHCQELMKTMKLNDENELQSYFIKRIEKFVNTKGKSIIGRDEILEGGLAPNAAVMSRGIDSGINAAKQKHFVVMTPDSHCYFDHYQGNPRIEPLALGGYTTVEKVYSYEPIPSELNSDEQKYILGAQANVWTEYMASPKQVEYMIFPRMFALSEVLWSSKEKRNYAIFRDKLSWHFKILEKIGANYSKSLYEIKTSVKPNFNGSGVIFEMDALSKEMKIYYTVDGSFPTTKSEKYTKPLYIAENITLKAVCFKGEEKIGDVLEQRFSISKSSGKKISLKNEPDKTYNYGGAFTLIDGVHGKLPWFGKDWLGFSGNNLEAIIDLGSSENISKVSADFLQVEKSWIYLPVKIEVLVSSDGDNFKSLRLVENSDIEKSGRTVKIEFDKITTRYVKIKAENLGLIPEGKPGEGNKAWLFTDEIAID